MFVRQNAVERIGDESVLVDVAKNASYGDVRKCAVERIGDGSVLVDVAKNASYGDVRRAAVERISDESVLVDIAKNDEDCYVRKCAVEKIGDKSVLADVAKNDSENIVRRAAAERIGDESVLFEIAKIESESILKEFEKSNQSTTSIYDLKDSEVLIIDRDGNNYLSWEEYYKVIAKKKEKIKQDANKKDGNFAKGNEYDKYYSDSIKFISENFNNKRLPNYNYNCEFVDRAVMLNPMTDRRTEGEKYYLCHFNVLKAIVVIGLTSSNFNEIQNGQNGAKVHSTQSNSSIFNGYVGDTIVFINCDFSNLNDSVINFHDCKNLKTISGDETSINSLMKAVPESSKYITGENPKYDSNICVDCGKKVNQIAIDIHGKCPHCGGISFKPNE